MRAGSRPILNLRGLLNNRRMAVRAAKMMLKTGLLEQFKQVDPKKTRNQSSTPVLRTLMGFHGHHSTALSRLDHSRPDRCGSLSSSHR